MTNQATQHRDAWERWWIIWPIIFYGVLIVCTVLAWVDNDLTAVDRNWILGFAAFSGLWYAGALLLTRLRWGRWRQPVLVVLMLAVIFVLWVLLVNRHPIYYFMLFALYGQLFFMLSLRWAIPGSIVLSALFAIQQTGSFNLNLSFQNPILLGFLLMSTIGVVFALWINAIISQSAERKQLIQELEQAQSELAVAERKAGILAERGRLAREIHDTLAQGFISIVTHLEAAEQAQDSDPSALSRHIDQARRTARESLEQARRVVQDLQPLSLEGVNLPQAIERVVQRWSEDHNIPAVATITGSTLPLHPEAEVTLLRTVQEALANVRKHAAASLVNVTLSYIGDQVILDVQDNGVGMSQPPNGTPSDSGGFGLIGMRQRVERLGGRLSIESLNGEGTVVVVEIPIPFNHLDGAWTRQDGPDQGAPTTSGK